MVVKIDVEVDGGVVARIVTGDVAREEVDDLRLEVVDSLYGDGVEVVWWKDLLVMVVLEKIMELVKIW